MREDDYIQIDMEAEYLVCAVATQGKSSGSYLTSYRMSFSTDGETWSSHRKDGEKYSIDPLRMFLSHIRKDLE